MGISSADGNFFIITYVSRTTATGGLANGLAAGIVALIVYILASAAFPLGFPESTYPLHMGVRYTLFVCFALCPVVAVILTLRSDQPKAVPE